MTARKTAKTTIRLTQEVKNLLERKHDEYGSTTAFLTMLADREGQYDARGALRLCLQWFEAIKKEPGGRDLLLNTQPEGFGLNRIRELIL